VAVHGRGQLAPKAGGQVSALLLCCPAASRAQLARHQRGRSCFTARKPRRKTCSEGAHGLGWARTERC
jgi:hypothetical protein